MPSEASGASCLPSHGPAWRSRRERQGRSLLGSDELSFVTGIELFCRLAERSLLLLYLGKWPVILEASTRRTRLPQHTAK